MTVLTLAQVSTTAQAEPSNFPRSDFPVPNGVILALLETNNTIYIGGLFTQIGGKSRQNLAAVDSVSGKVTDWNPHPDWDVQTLLAYGDTIFVGGRFGSVGGAQRSNLAAVDARTGQVTSWTTSIEPGTIGGYIASVNVLRVFENTLYIGGEALKVGGVGLLGAVDIVTGEPRPSWQPHIGGSVASVDTLAISSNAVYVGGSFSQVAFQSRANLAALDAATGVPFTWDPNPNAPVTTLALSSNILYIGGRFTNMGGQTRNGLAAVNVATGNIAPWDPSGTNSATIRALVSSSNTAFVAGTFQNIGGQSRTNLAAIDATTGEASTWSPFVTNQINALVVSGETVYVGGVLDNFLGIVSQYFAVFPQPGWSVLSQLGSTNGAFGFRLLGEEGSNYVIQASATLTNWSSVYTNTVTNGGFDFTAPATNLAPRFYRARSGP
jgi:hypothetical protein